MFFRATFIFAVLLLSELVLAENVRQTFVDAKYLSRPLDHAQIISSADTMTGLELDILISRLRRELKRFPDIPTEASKRADMRDLELLLQVVVNKAVTPDYIQELAFLSNEFAKKFYYLSVYRELWVYQLDHAWILAKRQITRDVSERARMDEYLQLTKVQISHHIFSRGEYVPAIRPLAPVDGSKVRVKGVSLSDFQTFKVRHGGEILTSTSDNPIKEGQRAPAIILPDAQTVPEEAKPLILLTEQGSRVSSGPAAAVTCNSLFRSMQRNIYVPSGRSLN